MIGDVVGDTDELVERQNQRAMPRRDHARSDRKILVLVPLAGAQLVGGVHDLLRRRLCSDPSLEP